eukprot:s689_g34.t1
MHCHVAQLGQALLGLSWLRHVTEPSVLWRKCGDTVVIRPRPEKNFSATLAACQCFGKLRALWQDAHALEKGMKTTLHYNLQALQNLSMKLSSPPNLPRRAGAAEVGYLHRLYRQQMGHLHLEMWRRVDIMRSFVDEDADHDKMELDKWMAHIYRTALASSSELWTLLHDLGNRCPLNIFQRRCAGDHMQIFHSFPAMQGPALEGQMLDFMGISTRSAVACFDKMSILLAPSRHLECEYEAKGQLLRNWPLVDEEYVEWSDVLTAGLTAAQQSSAQRGLRVAEIGAGPIGLWGIRTAKAFLRQSPDINSPCEVLLVEPFDLGDGSDLRNHTLYNLPEGRCQIRVEQKPVQNVEDLKALLEPGRQPWNLIDIDAQGWEYNMLCCGMTHWLASRAQRLHVSTHGRSVCDSPIQ